MNMRTELVASRNHLDDAIAQLFGIERADSHSLYRASLRDHFQQIGKFDLRVEILAVTAEMNSGENHFLEAACVKIVQRRDHGTQGERECADPGILGEFGVADPRDRGAVA